MSKTKKIKKSEHIITLKVKTESNGLGVLKTGLLLFMIALQIAAIALSNLFFAQIFQWYFVASVTLTLFSCIHALSSTYHGQAKATWVLFMVVCFSFGFFIYWASDKRILCAKMNKKYKKIFEKSHALSGETLPLISNENMKTNCNYLYSVGQFVPSTSSKTTYFSSGTQMFDDLLKNLESAEKFIFIEFYIVADGVLLKRTLDILKEKVQEGIDVRIIYDDMGSHHSLKRKTKKEILKSGIKLVSFNRMVPFFNIALNLRDHRKIVVIDGKIAYTGGANLADEYINEKHLHGYWKDAGIKVEGHAVDNFSIAFLEQWQFVTNENIDYSQYTNKATTTESDGIVVTFVTGPHYKYSIAQNMYANLISNAKEFLYIFTPYFVPDETITNLLINKAKSGVDVKIILPGKADKRFVYIVSRNNAEKLLKHGIKVYTMTNSFVHSKVMLNENSAIVGSINLDLRSFNQQFESAVLTDELGTLQAIKQDFANTMSNSIEVTDATKRRNRLFYRMLAGLFNIVSPFM